ncbi:MAG: deoxyribodipyrimidine photolyase [Proteocatella sp.]
MRHETTWRKHVAQTVDCRLVQVETNVIVPVEVASPKDEYSAATLRRKLEKVRDHFINPMKESKYLGNYSQNKALPNEFEIEDIDSAIKKLKIDGSVKRLSNFRGGTSEARKHLESFLDESFEKFSSNRNDPSKDCCSNLSPYLHFGQISPLYIYLKVLSYETDSSAYAESRKSFLEELFVRRELAMNFVSYNKNYDSYDCLPSWAMKTLAEHAGDHREYLYSLEELEFAKTHDEYWNAAQTQMLRDGKMHGYMRMYWGKKILQWSQSPKQAYATAVYLNNKYELDGRDPNGFAGVAWCFGKHDRAWGERELFGKVRYMVYSGLKRKFDMEKYINVWGDE